MPPPAAWGTTTVTGRLGYVCARAGLTPPKSSALKPSTSAAASLRLVAFLAGKKTKPESLQKNLE
jgi:hypothetical protein